MDEFWIQSENERVSVHAWERERMRREYGLWLRKRMLERVCVQAMLKKIGACEYNSVPAL